MSKLIIAEKPILGHDIAKAVCGKDGKFPIYGNGYTVVACAGHLLELEEPEKLDSKWGKPWKLEALPIDPRPWKKKVAKGKEKLVNLIKSELKKCDSVINAGDPDDEGQLIIDEVLDFLGYTRSVERVYVNDSIEKNIKRAFANLKDNSTCRGAGMGALARQYADFTFGANESRLACLKCRKSVSVGRVQTPTLGLVVNRDLDIANHIEQKYYELEVDSNVNGNDVVFKFKPETELMDENKRVVDNNVLEEIKEFIPNNMLGKAEITSKRISAPLPYNLTKLQSACSSQFGFSAQKTLDITQKLRDNYKAITYNRTDCQYLSSEHFKEGEAVAQKVLANLEMSYGELNFSRKHKAFNDKNISAHHAIIPQEVSVDIGKMTKDEFKVYELICKSYLKLFMPDVELKCSVVKIPVLDKSGKQVGYCEYSSNKVIKDGWSKLGGDDKSTKNYFLDSGQYNFDVKNKRVVEKVTAPPKHYTEGTLIADMASIAKYCSDPQIKEILKKKDEDKKGEHGGIGTTATRGNIIENLKSRGFLELKGKKIVSTQLGQDFYKLVPDNIKSADVTAHWWIMQEEVAAGKADVYSVADNVIKIFLEHKDSAYANAAINSSKHTVVGKCPICNQDLIQTGKIYQCSSNKSEKQADGSWKQVSGCGFKMFGSVCGKKLTNAQIKAICSGKTIQVKGLKSKAGKSFGCGLKLNKEPKKGFYGVDMVFDRG